jgi:hypothetical protein
VEEKQELSDESIEVEKEKIIQKRLEYLDEKKIVLL